MNVLWDRGPSTVRGVLEGFPLPAPGYTTALKLLQIMHTKGLVARDESERAHVYRAAAPREHTQRGLVGDLIERGFGGSSEELVLRALEARPASEDELQAIRRLIDRFSEDAS